MKIGIIGAGKWGQALQYALSQKNSVYITSRHKKEIPNFTTLKYLLENFEYLVIALPAQVTREWLEKNGLDRDKKVLVASKGIDVKSGKFLNQIYEKFLPKEHISFLTGPSFAKEVKEGLPTALVVNSLNQELALKFANAFPDFIKTYISDDVIGAEIAGAYKNVIAIASGICDGLKLGNNARAALMARGLVEMERFGKFFGGKTETFLGLSGAGDLFLTASSNLSRNYRVGFGLAQGKNLEIILKELGEVAEGVYTSEAIIKIAQKNDIYTPIAKEVYEILNGKNPHISLRDLLR
ncbi:NAD(P)H-dependent glycerol-3-phosphate dehydrogenase [Nitrosophilus kaiyonis]|uniref:NAD(P)H-dependent glycerol-3-phosphate dehydrogenase n=1 Tax=Nitrosophilus kaiyonis TaxID=2930200 RepID=UPI00249057DA|nr:NAD(P)H-dependent glycerol-3-phosphate dehydrogenase [Nitrosophilus kaiyonis]